MNIIIPMAGWGTRLRPHTLTVPKPLIKVAGKSIVEHLIEEINASVNETIEHVVFIIKPDFGPAIEKKLLETARRLHIKGHLAYQKEALGTAHAIYMAKKFLNGPVFVAYADTLFKGKLQIDPEADAQIVVKKVENPEQFGVVQLDETQEKIVRFVEKPQQFISDLAIVGIYYFKYGENLKEEISFLIDNGIQKSGEYQLTDALSNMLDKGKVFKPVSVEKWMDFGNKNAAVKTTAELLNWLYEKQGKLRGKNVQIVDSQIIEPCYLGDNVLIENSIIGPHVSIENNTTISHAAINNSLIGSGTIIAHARLTNSMIGNQVKIDLSKDKMILDLGDFSKIGF